MRAFAAFFSLILIKPHYVMIDSLIAKGIDKKRLIAKGYGESKPISTNKTDAGRQMNRRTELKIVE